jgi:hypothetical protein
MTFDHSWGNAGHNGWRDKNFYGAHSENFVNFASLAGRGLTSHATREPYEVCEAKGQKIA